MADNEPKHDDQVMAGEDDNNDEVCLFARAEVKDNSLT
jgi:hypothetical protein